MIADFYTLKYSTYARIVTTRKVVKVGRERIEMVDISLLGKGTTRQRLEAWNEIVRKSSEVTRTENVTAELVEQYERMNERRLGILICMRVLQDRESVPSMDALRRLGVSIPDDRIGAFKAAKAVYTGVSSNMEDIEAELRLTKQKPPQYMDYVREFNIVNEQMGGSMRFADVLLVEYLDARQLIKQRNDRD